MVFGEGASVFVMPNDPNPDHGGGPVRRGGPQTVWLDPPAGDTVYRTPHQVVREGEPGARWPGITRDKFLPDGRLVRQGALGGVFSGATSRLDPVNALNRVSNQYRTLRMQQGRIVATYRKLGAPIPCEVMSKFNAAVREYQIAGIKVLDAIRKAVPDVQLFQVPVDMDGKPLLDSKGQSVRRTIDVPLHPGGFVLGPGCKGFSGATAGAFGFGQGGQLGADWKTYAAAAGLIAVGVGLFIVAAPIGAVALAAVAAGTIPTAGAAAAVVATAAGATAAIIGVLKAIKIVWPDDSEKYVNEFTAWNEGRLVCLDKAAARGVKGEAAVKECGAAAGAPKPPTHGWGILAWIGLGTVVVGGAVAARYFYRRHKRLAPAAAAA